MQWSAGPEEEVEQGRLSPTRYLPAPIPHLSTISSPGKRALTQDARAIPIPADSDDTLFAKTRKGEVQREFNSATTCVDYRWQLEVRGYKQL